MKLKNFTKIYISTPDTNIHKYLENLHTLTLNNTQKENIGSFLTEKEIDTAIKEMNLLDLTA